MLHKKNSPFLIKKRTFSIQQFASLQALSKKSQNHFCIATLCQSFNCSSCYDLWQSFLLYPLSLPPLPPPPLLSPLPSLPSLPPLPLLPPIIFPKKICTIQILVLLLPRLVKKDWSHSSVG